jgi:SPP1 gp7 family putative phage head morphogenesis protein
MPPTPFDLPEPEILAHPVQPEAAIAFWAWKTAMPHHEVKKLADSARDRAFYVTALAEHDAVQGVKDALAEALQSGETFKEFQNRIADVIQAEGWKGDRIETIFRNNLQTAYSAGRYAKMQGVKKARPYWQYITVEDERVRPTCAILHNRVFPADHEFWEQHFPPNGHKCRCTVRTLSARQVEQEGLTVETEKPGPGVYTDPKTDMEYHVAFPGAADGWRNCPGKTWAEDIRNLSIKKLDAAPDLAPVTVRDIVQGNFEKWSENPKGDFPLVALSKADAEGIGGKSVVGRLSATTYTKQRKRHPELTAKDYFAAQDAVEQGLKIQQGKRNLAYVLDQPEGVVVIVKATVEGDELYVTSLRRMSRKDAEREKVIQRIKKKDEG